MGKFRSVRAKDNIKCDKCEQIIADGDMYLFNEEENIKLCHFCNYKMMQKDKGTEVSSNPKQSGDVKSAVSRLDDLIEKTLGKKED